ncbi:MAG: hypothetical protein D3926_07380 [Desulfobacteraceae bacterium]|nr:MAG: hypothetical protein D3926_07380 [Desulfobacteraceae bacterium]
MSDFLKKLRTQQKSSGKPRQSTDGHFYPHQENANKNADLTSEQMDALSKSINEILPLLSENCSSFISSIDQYIAAVDEVSKTKVKVNESISNFFDNLNLLLFGDKQPVISSTLPPHATTGYTIGSRYTKGEVIALIKSMRKEGATFAVIAEYLKDKGIPTFSGRGDWHAQTIHRLCK